MPRAPRICSRCGQRFTERRCPHCYVAWNKDYDSGSTRAERKLREQMLHDAYGNTVACSDCHMRPATELGHIIPRAYGGSNGRANRKPQCRPCNLTQIRTDRDRYIG